MEIKLFNSLHKKKETFKPIKEGHVSLYSCGPTVYNYAHIGNLRAFIFADTLKRMFLYNKYKVKHVMNITDVGHLSDDADEGEDKMEKGAKREGKTVWEIARFYEDAFKDDMHSLNIIDPEKYTRATEHIQEMIDMNKKLEENGFTYKSGGNLYFDTSKFENYWNLIGKPQDEDSQQSRVKKDENKKNHADFVLWFTEHKYDNHAMEWDSPWGKGFPGWHIECSAMSTKYLGDHFDIHTGGVDHISIHHTNEIAQNDCSYKHGVVNYWMHNEFLIVKDEGKMAKSSGNFLRLKTLTDAGLTPMDYRYFLLGTHYRKKIMFSFEAVEAAKNAMQKLKDRILDLQKQKDEFQEKIFNDYKEKLVESISDDLNTSKVLADLWNFIQKDKITANTKLKLIEEYDKVLGLKLSEIKEEKIPKEILKLKEARDEARKNKDFEKSDKIRDELLEKGYKVFDEKEGSVLRKI